MTDGTRPRSLGARILRTLSCLVLALGGFVVLGYLALAILIGMSMRECNAAPWISRSSPTPARLTLDAAHPAAEQTVIVRIPAEALPDDVPADGVLLNVVPSVVPEPGTTAQPADPGSGVLTVSLIGLDAGARSGRIVPALDTPVLSEEPSARSTILDCPREQACERTYRVVVSIAPSAPDDSIDIFWNPTVRIRSSSFGGCPGNLPVPSVEATAPSMDIQLASSGIAPPTTGGTVVATHVAIETEAAGAAAWALLRFQAEPGRWLPWVRVSDDAGRLLADGPIGEPWAPQAETLIEVPVLAHCEVGGRCGDGLWVVVQAIASDVPPFEPRWMPLESPARFGWSAAITSLGSSAGSAPTAPDLELDRALADPGVHPAIERRGPTVPLADGVTRSMPAMLHVPAQAAATTAGDWRLGTFAVASWYGHGISVTSRLEGTGAGPSGAYANGDGAANLVAHPFDACPAGGPCDVVIELVSRYAVDPHASVGGDPISVWDVSLFGVPSGSSVTFGPPVDRREPGTGLDVSALLAALAIVAGAVVVLFLVRRKRVRSRSRV